MINNGIAKRTLNTQSNYSKDRKFNWVPIISIAVVILLIVGSILIYSNAVKNKKYNMAMLLASRYTEDKEYNKATEEYNVALKIKPQSLDATTSLCNLLIKLNKFDEAENILSSKLSNGKGEDYFSLLLDLKLQQNKPKEAYDLILKQYKETKDEKYKEIFNSHFNVRLISDRYIYKPNETVTANAYITDKNNNILFTADEKPEAKSSNVADIRPTNGSLSFVTKLGGKSTISVKGSLFESSMDIIAIDNIMLNGIPDKIKVGDEFEVTTVGSYKVKHTEPVKDPNPTTNDKPNVDNDSSITNELEDKDNKYDSKTDKNKSNEDSKADSNKTETDNIDKSKTPTDQIKEVDLHLANEFILKDGKIIKYTFPPIDFKFNDKAVQKLSSSSDNSTLKFKAINIGDIKFNLVFDGFKFDLSKWITY